MIFTNQALALFPPSLGQAIAQTQRDRDELVEEICCRIGRPPVLLTQENVYPAACRAVLPDDLDYLLERATRASVYAAADQIRQGYLQTAGGCRVGLCGCAYGQAAGQIDGIRQLSSVSVRIPHAVPGCADALVPQLMKDGFCSTLILSPPGGGKTTLLRECVRRLSDQGLRISLMDERGEIAAVQNRTPQFDIGANTDIMTGGQKAACCMMLLRAMRPDVLAFDEISAPEDIEAIRIAAGCGAALPDAVPRAAGRAYFPPRRVHHAQRRRAFLHARGAAMTWAHGLGAALLFLGSTAAGFALRRELQQRAQLLAAVIDSLQLLRSDIVGRLLPLPEALRHTAETAPEPLHAQYTALADGITGSDRPFCEQWAAAIRALDMLTPDARAALLTLGAQLGKYDAQLQRQALDTCIASLQSISAALQDDARRRGKLVCGLGATLGLLAAVALL